MRIRALSTVVFLTLASSACTGDGGKKGGGPETLTGDMTGAVDLALTKPDPEESAFAFGASTDTSGAGQPFSTLVKIDANGNVDPVFNAIRPVYDVQLTDDHVAVYGAFTNVRVLTGPEEDEQAVDCWLVVFPRTATGEPVKCLSTEWIGNTPINDPENDYDARRLPGFTTRGPDVYFSTIEGTGPDSSISRLFRWAGGSDQIEQLLQLTADTANPDTIRQPFATLDAPNVCVTKGVQDVLCSPVTGTPDWLDMNIVPVGGNEHMMLVGTNLVLAGTVVNLGDRTATSPTTDYLPRDRTVEVRFGDSIFGITRQLSAPGTEDDLVRAFPPFGGEIIDNVVSWERILGVDDVAYVYGDNDLRRLDLATAVLGTTNLLGQTTLLQVTDFSLSTGGNLRLDGTTGAGLPAIVLIDPATGSITVTEADVPRFYSVTPLD